MNRFVLSVFFLIMGSLTGWAIPGKPTLLSPLPTDYPQRRPLFQWTQAANATKYMISLKRSNGSTYLEKWTARTYWTPTADLPEGLYDLRVIGYDGAAYGKWSRTVRFRRIFSPYLASVNGLSFDGGNIQLVAGPGIAIDIDPAIPGIIISATGTSSVEIIDQSITTLKLADNSVTSAKIANNTIVNSDIATTASITDSKLAAITSAGKVANSATTATSGNTGNAIVARDGSGNFTAGTISATAFSGGGASLTGLNASQLTSGTVPEARLPGTLARSNQVWLLGGNANTTAGVQFLGTTDDQPLEIKVNGLRAIRLEDNGDGAPNLIMGSPANQITAGIVGSVIGGGGATNFNFLPASNCISADHSVIPGGLANTILSDSERGVIGGGYLNTIYTNSPSSTISGGQQNKIMANAYFSVVAGGGHNTIESNSNNSAIGGGQQNVIHTGSSHSLIAGGSWNTIGTNASYSVIGGGAANTILGSSSMIPGGMWCIATTNAFAAGKTACAIHKGSFVWGDSTGFDVSSTTPDSVTMRASGGYRLFSNSGLSAGVKLDAGGTSWGTLCDRNQKKGFATVDGREVLEALAGIPITRWHYLWEADTDTPHIGPMAQDFIPAFYPGRDDTRITTQEADGVALVAIQGLNAKLEAKTALLQAENEQLKARLDRLEKALETVLGE